MPTYFLDTNQLLRLIIQDNLQQYQEVKTLLDKKLEQKINLVFDLQVFFEMQWVLLKSYNLTRNQFIFAIESILEMNTFEISNQNIFQKALKIYKETNLDLEDCYYIQICLEKNYIFASFDQKALKVYQSLKS
jgi:predicted nucleic-acid-binding protein